MSRYITITAVRGEDTFEYRATCLGVPDPTEIERLRVLAADHFVFEHGTFPSAVNVLNEEMVPGLDYKPVHGSLPENKAEDARKARRQAERIDRIKRERGFTDA